ncbi:hypothetical protein NA57DRAFT_49569 [Rhizodiscina lignyota]|uniref:RNase III domain-containing protein n=1 Tax=Rhizodiscina lignyota TaxID=1504668 RepID=A0A9P4I0N4_9PEZI|nr:hypothetical protein NA57DRAFT_49569 [Rhizodiscina lignyota]
MAAGTIVTKIAACEIAIAYQFSDKLLCATALHTFQGGIVVRDAFQAIHRNDRLAVYGDAVAASYLCRKWLDIGLQKSQWDTIRLDVLSNSNLAAVGFVHRLDRCINLNPGTTTVSSRTMATTLEAIMGAVHKDGGDSALGQVMAHLGLTHELLEVVMFNSPPSVLP